MFQFDVAMVRKSVPSFLNQIRSLRMVLTLTGVITSTVIPQRQIQFALKMAF
jgi:hypothetical protein